MQHCTTGVNLSTGSNTLAQKNEVVVLRYMSLSQNNSLAANTEDEKNEK